jgi:Family of unknown function (DUF7033)
MLIYAHQYSTRLSYMVDFISREIFIEPAVITTDKDVFLYYDGPKINYSETRMTDGEFHLLPVSLLFENDIRAQDIVVFKLHGMKKFFATKGGDYDFDILAAIFYLISRYEEYLEHKKDEYGRYTHTGSLAFREGFLDEPLVNNWLLQWQTFGFIQAEKSQVHSDL